MDRVRCAKCGEEHDLSDVEPSYDRPDAFFDVPREDREHLTSFGTDDGRIRNADHSETRHFLRALLPIAVRGERELCWGIWVEISGQAWQRARELWEDAAQATEPQFEGLLANELKGYTGTRGLRGFVQLTGPTTAPRFELSAEADHLLAREQREGVYLERALEWVMAHAH